MSKLPQFEVIRGETEIFAKPSYDLSIQTTSVIDVYPQSSVKDPKTPIVYHVQGNDTSYVNVRESVVYIRGKVVKTGGGNITDVITTAGSDVTFGTTNNFLNSAFERVNVFINETEITTKSSGFHPFRSYFENTLTYSENYKKSQLQAGGYYHQDDATSNSDKGWEKRRDLIKTSNEFELIGAINTDIWKFDRLIPPGLDIRIVLTRSTDKFLLECYGAAKYDIHFEILEAKLKVMKHTLLPSIALAHLQTWRNHPAVYPYRQSIMKTFSIPSGSTMVDNASLLNGVLPYRLVLGLLDTAAISGSYGSNPLSFVDNGLNKVSIVVNSDKSTEHVVELDVAGGRYMEAYHNVFAGLGCSSEDPSVDLTVNEFVKGKLFFVFDLAHSLNDGNLSIPKNGSISIHLRFKTATTKSLTAMLYLEYPAVLQIHYDKTVEFQEFN